MEGAILPRRQLPHVPDLFRTDGALATLDVAERSAEGEDCFVEFVAAHDDAHQPGYGNEEVDDDVQCLVCPDLDKAVGALDLILGKE